jgi:hypothetical protein
MEFDTILAFIAGAVTCLVAVVFAGIAFINWLPYHIAPKKRQIPSSKPILKNNTHLSKSGWLQVSLQLLSPLEVGEPDTIAEGFF